MSDLVERLRQRAGPTNHPDSVLHREAAYHIEALQKTVAAAEEAEWLTKEIFWRIWDDYHRLGGKIKVDAPDLATNWKAIATELRLKNREMHRRAQRAEASQQSITSTLESWNEVLVRSVRDGARKDRFLMRAVLRDLINRVGTLHRRSAETRPKETEIDYLLQALKPFADVGNRVLAEAPAESTDITIMIDCQGNKVRLALNDLRCACAIVAAAAPAYDCETCCDSGEIGDHEEYSEPCPDCGDET